MIPAPHDVLITLATLGTGFSVMNICVFRGKYLLRAGLSVAQAVIFLVILFMLNHPS